MKSSITMYRMIVNKKAIGLQNNREADVTRSNNLNILKIVTRVKSVDLVAILLYSVETSPMCWKNGGLTRRKANSIVEKLVEEYYFSGFQLFLKNCLVLMYYFVIYCSFNN